MHTHVVRSRGQGEAAAAFGREHRAAGRLLYGLLALASVALLLAAFAAPVGAAELSATQMKVSVWPEYDDPRVLVIYQADLDPNVQLPAEVTFNIPKGAEIGMACEVDSNDGHACKPFHLVDQGDYQTLTYTVETQKKIFLEYYYDAFPAGTSPRTFDFVYRPGFVVGTTTMEVQEPLRSTGLTVDPALALASTDSQGLTYHTQDYTDLPLDEPFSVKVSYSKTDANPSVQPQDGAASGGLSAAGGGSSNTALFVVLGVLGFGTMLVGGYKVMRPAPASSGGRRGGRGGPARPGRQRPNVKTVQASGKGRSRGGASSDTDSRAGASDRRFCTSCGSGVRPTDNFCPACGEDQG